MSQGLIPEKVLLGLGLAPLGSKVKVEDQFLLLALLISLLARRQYIRIGSLVVALFMYLHVVLRGSVVEDRHVIGALHLLRYYGLFFERCRDRVLFDSRLLLRGNRTKRGTVLNLKAFEFILELLEVLLVGLHQGAGVHVASDFAVIEYRFALLFILFCFIVFSFLRLEIAVVAFAFEDVRVLQSF